MNPHSNQKLTLRDLLKRIVPPLVVYRASLIPAIASEFTCCRRTVLRKMSEGFRQQFLRVCKNDRLVLTQKGIAFSEGTAPFFSSTRFSPTNRGAVKGGRFAGLVCSGCGAYTECAALVNTSCHPSSRDKRHPLYKGVVCRRHVGPDVEQFQNDFQRSLPHPNQSPNDQVSNITALYCSFWPIMSNMPRLLNWPDRSLPFDYAHSEVVRFAMHRCGIGLAMAVELFYLAIDQGVISFDSASMMWAGVKGGSR